MTLVVVQSSESTTRRLRDIAAKLGIEFKHPVTSGQLDSELNGAIAVVTPTSALASVLSAKPTCPVLVVLDDRKKLDDDLSAALSQTYDVLSTNEIPAIWTLRLNNAIAHYLASSKLTTAEGEIDELNRQLNDGASRWEPTLDPLTGLKNRSAFWQRLEEDFFRSRRYGDALGLLIAKLDDTERFAGDTMEDLLVKVGETIKGNLRICDSLARYGETTFAIILPNIPPEDTQIVADRLCRAVTRIELDGCDDKASLSIGISTNRHVRSKNSKSLVVIAEQGVTEATGAGGNQCVLLPQDWEPV